ncbi:ATP-binding cassette domain-containing protein [Patescibacteria group bacterium]|nr:ATP-binding cassette domain-containing protein [Patescibacteria group bacterium]
MIEVNKLTKKFGHILAVDNVSFDINKGEVVGFLGPNGAGKTTTMRIITGFLSPDRGDVKIVGISVNKDPINARKLIGYLPENNPLYGDMLVSEMVNFTGKLQNIKKTKLKKSIEFIVNATGISEIYYRPIKELSKGYKQRVGIALALLGKPKVIILDEPTEGLDPNQRIEIRELIKNLAKDRTVILSTHVMQEASAVCSRLIVINKGRIISDGSPEDIARSTQPENIIVVKIQGNDVQKHIERLDDVQEFDLLQSNKDVLAAKIIVRQDRVVEPQISKLSRTYNWTIWKMYPQEKQLEDVFRILTSRKD